MECALDEAFGLKILPRRELAAVLDANPTRRGVKPLRDLLGRRLTSNRARSLGQERLIKLIRSADLPESAGERKIGGGFSADLWWPQARVACEFDSRKWHESPTAWARDQRKNEYCRRHEITLVRAIWADLAGDAALKLAARLAALIAARGGGLAGADG
jgi:hypothetical protein